MPLTSYDGFLAHTLHKICPINLYLYVGSTLFCGLPVVMDQHTGHSQKSLPWHYVGIAVWYVNASEGFDW